MFKFLEKPKVKKFLEGGSLLTIMTVIGVAIGIGLGLGLRGAKEEKWTAREVVYLKFVGDLFLRTLGALILPLIVSSLIDAVGSLDLSLSKKIGIRALLYYLSTTALAAVLGLVLGMSVQPGNGTDLEGGDECKSQNTSTVDTILDLVRNAFPNNLVGATLELTQTNVLNIIPENSTELPPFNDRPLELIYVRGTNMMGLVIFSMVLGVTLGQMGEAGKPVLLFFRSLGEATMSITSMVVSMSPVAICFLVAGQLVEQDDIVAVFENISWYFGTVLIGLLIHGFILLPLTFILLVRKSPLRFFLNMFQAMATAFGTASSSATLPVTIKCLEEKNKLDTRVSRFVIPIGATVNMNGTAIYLPIGAIYIAQLCGQSLSIGQLISISLISIATSIGAAGIPQVGMVIMITVLNSVGLPTSYIAYIMPVDWLLERFRTVVNILGDSFGAAIVNHMSRGDLAKIDNAKLETDEISEVDIDNNRRKSSIAKQTEDPHLQMNGIV